MRFRTATRDSIEFAGAYEDLKIMHAARSGTLVAKRTARPKALVCAEPIRYVGQDELRVDLDNLKAALKGQRHEEVFVTAISPSNLELYYENQHYKSDEEYLAALSDAMRVEYLAIVEAGFRAADRRPADGDALQPGHRCDDRGLPQVHRACGSRR